MSVKSWPKEASLSAQQFPSRKIWEQITIKPSWKQLCHLFRRRNGIREWFLKASTTLEESHSNQTRSQELEAADSIAIIKPISSASKTDTRPMLLAKQPKNVPRKSRKIPPQEALKLTTEPSVFALTQLIVGGFQTTRIISLTRLWIGGIKKLSRTTTSSCKQLLLECIPDKATNEVILAMVAFKEQGTELKRRALRANQMQYTVWTMAATKTSSTCELHLSGIQSNKVETECRFTMRFILRPRHLQSVITKSQFRKRWEEDSACLKQRTQIDTIVHPRNCKFSSVGSLDNMSRQKTKEWDGGIADRQISAAHSSLGVGGLR